MSRYIALSVCRQTSIICYSLKFATIMPSSQICLPTSQRYKLSDSFESMAAILVATITNATFRTLQEK